MQLVERGVSVKRAAVGPLSALKMATVKRG